LQLGTYCYIAECCIPNVSFMKIGAAWYAMKLVVLDRLLSFVIKKNYHSFFIYVLKLCGARADPLDLLNACKNNDTDLAIRCLWYGANPRNAIHIRFSGYDIR